MKKNVIITCANEKIGDFVINHWLKSLRANVNLKNTDVVVIDYGLSSYQKNQLIKNQVILFKGTKKYHIVNKRFFDASKYLKDKKYNQLLFVDGGDIIFQKDIEPIINSDKNTFRVVSLGEDVLFYKWLVFGNFEEKIKEKIWKVVKNKQIINAGVIFAPVKKFLPLCDLMKKMIKNKDAYWADQIILNYYLYKHGFKFINNEYNFIIYPDKKGFFIKNGIFYRMNGKKIAVVHNAGKINLTRSIKNFGYGKRFNKIKYLTYNLKKIQYKLFEVYKKNFVD